LIAVVLLAGAGLFWASHVLQGFRDFAERHERVKAELAYQETVLSRAETVEADIATRLAEVESEQSLTAASFVEAVDRISRGVGLAADMDPVETRDGEMVSVHRLDLGFSDIAIVPLIDFTRRMENDSLPVSIEEMLLSVNERTPERLDVVLRLAGFEFRNAPSELASTQ
jgi:hypothetical protein